MTASMSVVCQAPGGAGAQSSEKLPEQKTLMGDPSQEPITGVRR